MESGKMNDGMSDGTSEMDVEQPQQKVRDKSTAVKLSGEGD